MALLKGGIIIRIGCFCIIPWGKMSYTCHLYVDVIVLILILFLLFVWYMQCNCVYKDFIQNEKWSSARDCGTDFFLGERQIFLISLKISYYKNFLIDWPNLGEARASVLHRFRDACLVKYLNFVSMQCLNVISTIYSQYHLDIFRFLSLSF